jgi:hypothetical protein
MGKGTYLGGSTLMGSSVGFIRETSSKPRHRRRALSEKQRKQRAAKRAADREQRRLARTLAATKKLEDERTELARTAALRAKRASGAQDAASSKPIVVVRGRKATINLKSAE